MTSFHDTSLCGCQCLDKLPCYHRAKLCQTANHKSVDRCLFAHCDGGSNTYLRANGAWTPLGHAWAVFHPCCWVHDLKVGVSFSKQDKTRSFSGHESVIRHHKDHYADATAPEPCKSPSPHGKERRPALCHRVPAHTLWPNFTARMQFQPVVALQLLLSSLEETSPCTAHRV